MKHLLPLLLIIGCVGHEIEFGVGRSKGDGRFNFATESNSGFADDNDSTTNVDRDSISWDAGDFDFYWIAYTIKFGPPNWVTREPEAATPTPIVIPPPTVETPEENKQEPTDLLELILYVATITLGATGTGWVGLKQYRKRQLRKAEE